MAYLFPSDEWIKELMEVVNKSDPYASAADKWEGDLNFVVEPGPGLKEPIHLYMDLWHGKCRSAGVTRRERKRPSLRSARRWLPGGRCWLASSTPSWA
jgi:hypothetical protein